MVRLAALMGDRRRDESGAVVLLVAAMTVAIFGVAALVVDLGQARIVRGEAQAASDASALAAANRLYLEGKPTPNVEAAIAAAHDFAADNYGVTEADWASCQDPGALTYKAPATSYDSKSYVATECISFDDADPSTSGVQPSTARVVAPLREVNLVFAAALGAAEDIRVSAQANASLKIDSVSDCALCVVGFGPHDLQNGDVKISGGGNVAINGNVTLRSNGEVNVDGVLNEDGTISAPTISVSGTAAGTTYTPAPLQNQQPIQDPLATIPLPTDLAGITPKSNTDPCGTGVAHGPGVYGDFDFGASCVLEPGLYVVTGDWELAGNADQTLTGTGVTLYFTCGTQSSPRACVSPGEQGGSLIAHGNGTINLTAPTVDPYKGLVIAYDRLNTSPLWLTGNGASKYTGTIYARAANMRYDGNGCTNTSESLIVVGSLEFNGNQACLQSNYTKDANVYVPPDGLHLSQ